MYMYLSIQCHSSETVIIHVVTAKAHCVITVTVCLTTVTFVQLTCTVITVRLGNNSIYHVHCNIIPL